MHIFLSNFDKIYQVLTHISSENLISYQRRKPKLSDLALISINLTAEYLGFDSECDLFRKLPPELSDKIERSVYNRRKRRLFVHIENIRTKLSNAFNEFEDCFIIDSMPLEICKEARSNRSKICKDQPNCAPNKGYCASQNSRYYGYKLHAVCSVSGVFKSLDISPASVHDINYLKDIQHQIKDCTLIGDRGYLSAQYQLDLFEKANIKLNVPMRLNQNNYRKQPYVFRKSRKRIETLFSQLCDQFMIRRNYAKSFDGFKTRILSKITAMTFIFDRNINNIKISII